MKNKSRMMGSKRLNEMRCPYCGAPAVFRSADGIYRDNSSNTMLYVCARYPACDAYVRTHPGSCVRSARQLISILTSCIDLDT